MNRTAVFLVLSWVSCAATFAQPGSFIAGYHLDEKLLLLGKSLQAPDGSLRKFQELSGPEIATIYHELWHAWILECDTPRREAVYQRMRREVDEMYADFPEDKRMEIQEEAIAAFVDAAVETYVVVYRHLQRLSPTRRKEIIDTTEYLERTYGQVFADQYDGYYTRSIGAAAEGIDGATSASLEGKQRSAEIEVHPAGEVLGEFFERAEKIGLPVGYLREAAGAIKGVVFLDLSGTTESPPPRADVVFSGVFLQPEELKFISRTLLEGKLPPDPRAAFAEERFEKAAASP